MMDCKQRLLMKYLESRQTGFTSRCGSTKVAFNILATATASHILEAREKGSQHRSHSLFTE